MLEELHVRDLALIEEAWLGFGPGMTVLTGETGAGKTVLLGALKLLLGERADTSSVRAGCAEALVEGRFVADGDDMLVRRRVGADGRSRCTIDDEMATVGALASRVGPLVDLHGQHEHQALLSSASHVGYLDRWAGVRCADALEAYRTAKGEWVQARDALADLEARVAAAREHADSLRVMLAEVDKVAPETGEDERLRERLPALRHAERLDEAASEAARLLRGDGGAQDSIAQASAALARVSGIDADLDAIAARIAEAEALVDDAGLAARAYRDRVEHNPAALEAAESRLAELSGLVKRFGPTLDDAIRQAEQARAALEAVDGGESSAGAAREAERVAAGELAAASERLRLARLEAAPGFCEALGLATEGLAMAGARFEVDFAALPFESWTDEGPDRIEFLYSPAPGQPARPLARIASGGELSRVMLALKCVLGSADQVETLVFDEVDAGIGGATATRVGERLRELARAHQVIVVTHLAQVAAFADMHVVVRKVLDEDSAATTVAPVEGDDRVAEIARMLSGDVSDASVQHAAELLTQAGSSASPA